MTDRFEAAAREFEAAHEEDPRKIVVDGREVSRSRHYHERLVYWVERLESDPSEALRLAARCQHIRRWTIPRETYREGRDGYRKWRRELAEFHVLQAAEVLSRVGCETPLIERVSKLLRKEGLKRDPEVQLFEDAICLVFLENELAEFAERHRDEESLENILRKTWKKMSDSGRNAALNLTDRLPARLRELLTQAVSRKAVAGHSTGSN
jgi:hypothetical protein